VPPEVDALILQTLAKDPSARWPNAATLRRAIDKVRSQLDAHASNATVYEWIDWAMKQKDRTAEIEDLSALAVESNTRSVVMEVEQRTIIGAAPAAGAEPRTIVTMGSAPVAQPGMLPKTTLPGWAMQKSPLPPAAYPVSLATGTAPPAPAVDSAPTMRDPELPLLPDPHATPPPKKSSSSAAMVALVLLLCAAVAVGVYLALSYAS
jgi:serine/threonine-protein kinase